MNNLKTLIRRFRLPLFIGVFILSNLFFFFLVLPDVGQSASFVVRVVRCFSLHSLCERAPREVSWAYQQTERSSGDRHRIWQVGSGKLTVLLCEMFEVKSKWSMKLGKSVHHLLSYFSSVHFWLGAEWKVRQVFRQVSPNISLPPLCTFWLREALEKCLLFPSNYQLF